MQIMVLVYTVDLDPGAFGALWGACIVLNAVNSRHGEKNSKKIDGRTSFAVGAGGGGSVLLERL